MRDQSEEIRAAGGELVFIGNGSALFANGFAEDLGIESPILIDPDLVAYRAAGLRRGRAELFSPRMIGNAVRAFNAGYRQTGVEGDAFQLGGVLVVRRGGDLVYRYASREAGDHPPVSEVLAALEPDAPRVLASEAPGPVTRTIGELLSWIVDPTIALSFDRTGFAIHSLSFDPAALDVELSGKRCLVTGANSGIGFETALGLADLGAEVVLLCRDAERGEAARARIMEASGNTRISVELLDISNLAEVREVGSRLAAAPVDVLVHNAGVLPDERIETRDGLELTFATHVAGPFLLTKLLAPAMGGDGPSRVVWVSSGGMYTQSLQVRDPQWTARSYDGVRAYAETKRAQVVLAQLWAEELGSKAVVTSMHPGWADTPAVRTSLPRFYEWMAPLLRSPAQGADTVLWLAAAKMHGGASGSFFFDRRPRPKHFLPFTGESDEARRAYWDLCEQSVARTDADDDAIADRRAS